MSLTSKENQVFCPCCPVWSSDTCNHCGHQHLNIQRQVTSPPLSTFKYSIFIFLFKKLNWKPTNFTNRQLALMISHEYSLCCIYNLFKLSSNRGEFKAHKICLLALNKMSQCHHQSFWESFEANVSNLVILWTSWNEILYRNP